MPQKPQAKRGLLYRRRAKRIADIDFENEWSELQKASRT